MTGKNGVGPRPLIAGNWKMNGGRVAGVSLAGDLSARLQAAKSAPCEILVCPPAPLLFPVGEALSDAGIALGAQDCHTEPSGAHTGDVSPAMLVDAGCTYVIVGHSERRTDHGETDELVREKAKAAYGVGLTPVICVGETLADRDSGAALTVVSAQLKGSVPDKGDTADIVIAYEPVWAIGTGRVPEPDDIGEMHAKIRSDLHDLVSDAARVRILYGGSVKATNAVEILGIEDVNGALVGGASLIADDFWGICTSCP